MGDESRKRAAQEYLAARLAQEGQSYEDKLNREAAVVLAPRVWKQVTEIVIAKCNEWNAITKEDPHLQGNDAWRSSGVVRRQIASDDRALRFQGAFDHLKEHSAS